MLDRAEIANSEYWRPEGRTGVRRTGGAVKMRARTPRPVAHLDTAPDRGRSPSAACRPAEADCKKSVLLCLAMRCEPGRFAVRRGQCQEVVGKTRRLRRFNLSTPMRSVNSSVFAIQTPKRAEARAPA